MENKRDPEENSRSLYPLGFALAPAGVPGLGASPGVWDRHMCAAGRTTKKQRDMLALLGLENPPRVLKN